MARILFLDQFATLGGGQRILVDVVEAFAAQGHEVLVAIPPATGAEKAEVAAELDVRGLPHTNLNLPHLSAGTKGAKDVLALLRGTVRMRLQIKDLVRSHQADLIYVNGPRCLPAAVLAGKPVVAAIHLIHEGKERRLLEWCFARRNVRLVTFCSKFAASPFKTPKAKIVPNWVSPAIADAPNMREPMRAQLGLREDQVAVGVLGRISPNKGQAFLIEALRPVLCDTLQLFIAGAPDHEKPSPLPKHEFVHELGKVDPAPFLDAMDILVVPTLIEEAFGLTAVEGMARCLPVIATRSGGLAEVVVDGSTGFVVDRVPTSISDAVSFFSSNPAARAEMGRSGNIRSRICFSATQSAAEVVQLSLAIPGL